MSCRLPEQHKKSLPIPLADVLVIGRSLYGVTGRLEEEMAAVFGATSTTEEVLSGVNLRDKRILVTGVSAGLGVETARSLAGHGALVPSRT